MSVDAGAPGVHLVADSPLPYLLSLPAPTEGRAEPHPLLCFLHGYDEAAPLPIRTALTRHGPLRPGNPPAAAEGMVVVAPQLPAPGGDVWHRHASAVLEIVREVLATHNGDPQRCYLTGFSFGGSGVWDLALAAPDLWAALWPVDPTRLPAADPLLPVWLSSGRISRRLREGFVQRLRLEPLDPAGAPGPRVYLDEGLDHVGTATSAYRDERIYHWLLSRRRA